MEWVSFIWGGIKTIFAAIGAVFTAYRLKARLAEATAHIRELQERLAEVEKRWKDDRDKRTQYEMDLQRQKEVVKVRGEFLFLKVAAHRRSPICPACFSENKIIPLSKKEYGPSLIFFCPRCSPAGIKSPKHITGCTLDDLADEAERLISGG